MIYEFLKKETDNLIQELNVNKNHLINLETKKLEIKKFMQIINESMDRKYAGFTPYEVNKEEEIKIEELKLELKSLEEDISQLKISISKEESKVSEYEKMTEYSKLLEHSNKEKL